MPVSADTFRRLAALRLEPEAMSEVLSIIGAMQADEDARRTNQAARTRKFREKRDGNVTETLQKRDSDVTAAVAPLPTLPCPSHTLPLPPSHSDPLVGDRTAEAVEEPPPKPLSPLDRLWIEGVPVMTSMGIAEKQARSLIGRWLKSASNVPLPVLDAIQRARDHRIVEPVAWITRSLAEKPHERPHNDRSGISAAFDKLDARLARRESAASGHDGPELDLAVADGLPRLAQRLG